MSIPYVPLLVVDTALGSLLCARAIYVCVRATNSYGEMYGMQIMHCGIDPSAPQPHIFGGFQWKRRGFSYRFNIPFAAWRYKANPVSAWLRNRVQRALWAINAMNKGGNA